MKGAIMLLEINTTEKKIMDAFMKLYADHPIDKISIKMIMEIAGFNRGTFYLHYMDIYDLREKVEDIFTVQLKEIGQRVAEEFINEGNLLRALPEVEFYENTKEYLKVLLTIPGKSQLPVMMKKELKIALHERFDLNFNQDTFQIYALEYLTSAQLALITQWIKDDMKVPLDEVTKHMYEMSTTGGIEYLKNSYQKNCRAIKILE